MRVMCLSNLRGSGHSNTGDLKYVIYLFFFSFLNAATGGKKSVIWQRKSLHRTSIHRWDEGVGVTGAGHLWLLYAQKMGLPGSCFGQQSKQLPGSPASPVLCFCITVARRWQTQTAWGVRCCSQPAPRCSSVMLGDKHAVKQLDCNIHQRCARPRESCRWSFFFLFFFASCLEDQ